MQPTTKRFLRRPQVQDKTGLATSSLYDKMAAGEFPKPIKLGALAVAWDESEVDAWMAARIAERDKAEHKTVAAG
jgi:prophage regulatory protein